MADRVLLVEDEAHLAEGIRFNLQEEGYAVDVIGDGRQALVQLTAPEGAERWDLVLLDVMLPGLDGFSVAARVREAGNFVPILMLTAKSLPEDVVQGLEAGADDYLPKPFDLPVLLARVKGLLRRRDWTRDNRDGETTLVGDAEVDFAAFELRRAGNTIRMTLLETMLLKLLVENAGRVVTRAQILEKVWNVSPDTQTRAVENFIVRLRRYIEPNPRFPSLLKTVRGAGYRLDL